MKKTNVLISLNDLANSKRNKFVVVKIDETENWRDDIKNKAGKIEGVYLVNLKQPTHLCELAISYPATFLKNFIDNWEAFDEDELSELERENGGEEFCYLRGENRYYPQKIYNSGTEEDILDYEMGNPTVC